MTSVMTERETVGQGIRERRQHRRHDVDVHRVPVERWDGVESAPLGVLVDLSSGGMRFRTPEADIRPDQQIRLRFKLPVYAGICPFIDTSAERIKPKNEWSGWLAVSRVQPTDDGDYEIGGRMVDMESLDRGMLSLYLSTHPLA
jgi:hypothetical protein